LFNHDRQLARSLASRAYTLVELLIVVVLLGIAAAMVIPQMGSANALRVQSVVRSIVADIGITQSDALARQQPRAIVFDTTNNNYKIYQVRNGAYQPQDLLQTVTLFETGDTGLVGKIESAKFDATSSVLVFDELGGPVKSVSDSSASSGGTIRVSGYGSVYDINVEAYTGRVTVVRISQ
jgi:general secretion pathway protein H